MKKIFYTIGLILLLNIPAWAQDIQPHVTVYGTATRQVTPDEMVWSLKVDNKGSDIAELAKQHSRIVLSALSFVGKTGVAKEDMQTSMMQFGENWEHQNGRRIQDGFFASSRVTFKLTDFTKYQQLWTGLSKIKNMSIQNIGYGYSKRIEVQDKTRIEALLAGQKKAHAMANALNAAIGAPLVIEDDQAFSEPRGPNLMMASEAAYRSGSQDTAGFALGKILIKSNVKLVYQLIHQKEND
jgi:uncharacterized protein